MAASKNVEKIKGIRDQIKRAKATAVHFASQVEELESLETAHTLALSEPEKAELDRAKK